MTSAGIYPCCFYTAPFISELTRWKLKKALRASRYGGGLMRFSKTSYLSSSATWMTNAKQAWGYLMKTAVAVLALFFVLASFSRSALCQSAIRARTETGEEVLLFSDGTWKHVQEGNGKPSQVVTYSKPASAQKLFKMKRGDFGVWVDESVWQGSKPKPGEAAEVEFDHAYGGGSALAIVERIPMPMDALRDIAIKNMEAVATSDVKVVREEYRIVNGRRVLCLVVETAVQRIPVVYYAYYYSGQAGTIQLLTWTGQSLFERYQQDLLDFLNGLEVYE